jgi:two-component system cell cycle sensor histidine kinase/response regulator CckA
VGATRLFDDPTLGVFFARPTTGLADCNLTFARLLGFESVGEALGSDLSFVFVSAEQQRRFYGLLEQHGRIEYFRGPVGRRDGRVSDVVATILGGFDAAGMLAESNLESVLRRLIREDIGITIQRASVPAQVRIDPTQLEQVVLNLASNAQDPLSSGGTIARDIAKVYLAPNDLPIDQGAQAGDYVRLRVTDDGVGIEPEVRAHLFEPFFTTKGIRTGSGLGNLVSVYGIVGQSGGFISVDSEVGCGTTFTMHLPAVAVPEKLASTGPSRSQKNPVRQATILLAEDEDAVRAIVCTVLRRQGYRVLEAVGGKAACEIFDRHGSEIDLLLTDVVMPEMNGPALAQRLVGLQPQLRVLFISGYSEVSPLDPTNPNISFLSKPFQASVLAEKVKQVLSRARQAS